MSLYEEENSLEEISASYNLHYPNDPEYDYYVMMERIDLDKECEKDLSNNHGFIIKEPQPINKALKSEDSIFSSKFGRSLQDKDPYANRYSCKCGHLQGSFKSVPGDANWVCPICGTSVRSIGDDFTFFGWIRLKDQYCVIHPMMYQSLAFLIGKDNLEAIIEPEVELDADGNPMTNFDKRLMKKKMARKYKKKKSLDVTYAGIGMLEFRDKFDEIINYFYSKKPAKKEVYDDIVANKHIVFTHSIPVYTTQLRIAKVENRRFAFEETNADFNLLAKLAATINKDNLSIYRNEKEQNRLLWDMQAKLSNLTEEIIATLTGKKGVIRSTISGRVSFSERTVIVPDSSLKMDEVTLPYFGLVVLLEQIIINILQKSYNITYSAAFKIWYKASLEPDKRVVSIIENLIKANKINVLINRNPTIAYYSIVYKRVVKVTMDYVMGMDIYTLTGLNADFDGDVLNISLFLNEEFRKACERIYSPRNAFCISRDDGKMNSQINIFKDTVVNINSFKGITNDNYSPAQLKKIRDLKEKYKDIV